MDTCVMAAQLLAHCLATGPGDNPASREDVPSPTTLASPRAAVPAPSAMGDTQPETNAMPSAALGDSSDNPDCLAWGRIPKPKAATEISGCSTVATPSPTPIPAPSIPLRAEATPPPVTPTLAPPPLPSPRPTSTVAVSQPVVASRPNPTHQPGIRYRPTAPQPASDRSPSPETSAATDRLRPVNGSQMYALRRASLQAGQIYTRADPQRYVNQWRSAQGTPTHPDWQALLQREAAVMAQAQGRNRLTVVVGDSLALWLPPEVLPQDRFWLNQSISGETTTHMLRRLHYFAPTRPDTIHILAGINDLRQGASAASVADNLQRLVAQLRQQHPQAHIIVHSILPTRWDSLPRDRIQQVNRRLADLARQRGVTYVDWQTAFTDDQGQLRREFTTDGLHLSRQGYAVWQAALVSY